MTWHILPDVLAYYTWSQGFRPGAFNRSTGCYIPDATGINQYCSPLALRLRQSDQQRIGWKTEFFDHRLQWNGAVYQEDWNNVQVAFFDPGVLGNVGFGTNGPNYRIRGVETSIIAAITRGLTAQGAASWNSSTQTNSPFLIANNPDLLTNPATKGEFGQPILERPEPYGPPGGPSAEFAAVAVQHATALPVDHLSYNAFAQAGVTHTAHSFTQSSANPAASAGGASARRCSGSRTRRIPTFDASIGIAKDAWTPSCTRRI